MSNNINEDTPSEVHVTKRDKNGRFVDGSVGNPEGKKGYGAYLTSIKNNVTPKRFGEIVKQKIEDGDTRMILGFWDRVEPTEKQQGESNAWDNPIMKAIAGAIEKRLAEGKE